LADDVTPEDALAQLGKTYEVMNVGFKPYSCCGSNHTSVNVILSLKEAYPDIKQANISKLIIYTTTTWDGTMFLQE
jgi:aconitate decarboxylase